jgi:hypothetical protein
MAQPVNGVLYVDYFTPTGNPGEYRFENGVYNTQTDLTGQGAYALDTSFVMFVPVLEPNTAAPALGVVNRYRLKDIAVKDNSLISGTIVFDESGLEIRVPAANAFCLVSQTTQYLRLAAPPADSLYTDLIAGGTIAAMLNDLVNIIDHLGRKPVIPDPAQLFITANGQVQFELPFTPADLEKTELTLNGLVCQYGLDNDYSINGRILHWHSTSVSLDVHDKLVIR